MFRNFVGWMTIFALFASPSYSAAALTTANVNFRAGPSTSFESFGVIPDGSQVDLLDCDASGSWCGVSFEGQEGFISGRYLQTIESGDGLHWPRAYALEGDAFIVLYQPQISDWDGASSISALIAAEYRTSEEAAPIFGVLGLTARVQRESEAGALLLHDMRISSIDFTALDREQLAPLALELNGLLPTGPVPVAEERVVANLVAFQQVSDVPGLNTKPPAIFVSLEPAILVQSDGPAVFAPVAGIDEVEFVLNTNWDLFRVEDTLFLRHENSWITASEISGPWQAVDALPDPLKALPDDGNWDAVRNALEPAPFEGTPPIVLYSDVPAELILFDGDPVLEAVRGTDLEWASNTEADLFRHVPTGAWYYLVSGRWFRTFSREGPFEFANNDLPPDFRFLPDDAPYYTVRASVPGTSEANEARLRAMIPEMAQVEIGSISPEISYDGTPAFAPIDGTSLQYAVNTGAQVIQVGIFYYLVQDGVWFVGESPEGPWRVATEVPAEIYDIPPTSPVHNVTYVRVYESTESTVSVGYTAGYLFAFLAWGAIVHGTGWYYPPYWRYGPYPVYYPRPLSYGGAAYYNPALGTYGRYGYAYGPYRGIEARAAWNPATGTYVRGARAYGPYGSRGFVHAYNPRTDTRAVARGGSNIYGRWGSASVRRGSDYVRVRAAEGNVGNRGVRWDSSRGSGFALSDRRGNVYAGRDGNVYRRVGDDWQRWNDGGWSGVEPPRRTDLIRERSGELRTQGILRTETPLADRIGTGTGTLTNRTPVRSNVTTVNRSTVNRVTPTQRTTITPRVTTPRRVPTHIQRDLRNREIGNQRHIERRVHSGGFNRSTVRSGGGNFPRAGTGRPRLRR